MKSVSVLASHSFFVLIKVEPWCVNKIKRSKSYRWSRTSSASRDTNIPNHNIFCSCISNMSDRSLRNSTLPNKSKRSRSIFKSIPYNSKREPLKKPLTKPPLKNDFRETSSASYRTLPRGRRLSREAGGCDDDDPENLWSHKRNPKRTHPTRILYLTVGVSLLPSNKYRSVRSTLGWCPCDGRRTLRYSPPLSQVLTLGVPEPEVGSKRMGDPMEIVGKIRGSWSGQSTLFSWR